MFESAGVICNDMLACCIICGVQELVDILNVELSDRNKRFLSVREPFKRVSCVACRSFCRCSVACFIVLNVAVAFEKKLKLYVGLVMLHVASCRDFPDNFCRLSAL